MEVDWRYGGKEGTMRICVNAHHVLTECSYREKAGMEHFLVAAGSRDATTMKISKNQSGDQAVAGQENDSR